MKVREAFAGPLISREYFRSGRIHNWNTDMPRIADFMLDGIAFLYRTEDEARRRVKLGGTGFIVTREIKRSKELVGVDLHVPYLISNRHVVFGGGASVVSINRRDGSPPAIFPFEPTDWTEHSKREDLAAISLMGYLNHSIHTTAHILESALLTEGGFKKLMIGVGDEVFMIGRFINHQGLTQNRPAARFGSISMGPENIWVKQDNRFQESIAVEMRSRTGFSGAPVAVYRNQGTVISVEIPNEYKAFWALLGVNWGYILDEEGENTWLNGVVPAWKILELFEEPALKKKQEQIEADFLRRYANSGTDFSAVVQSFGGPPASDENPIHREDFMRLVGAAARKPESKD